MPNDITLRPATPADAEEIMRHRRSMFLDMGYTDAAQLDAMARTSLAHIARGLKEGAYRGWLAVTPQGECMGGGGIVLFDTVSHPRDPRNQRAYILNVYTYPQFRRRGVARRIMQAIVEWCRSASYGSVALHASDEGRALYESMGFKQTNEMRLDFRQ